MQGRDLGQSPAVQDSDDLELPGTVGPEESAESRRGHLAGASHELEQPRPHFLHPATLQPTQRAAKGFSGPERPKVGCLIHRNPPVSLRYCIAYRRAMDYSL
jgi:hypothetical protein